MADTDFFGFYGRMAEIFVSYSRSDAHIVDQVVVALKQAGHGVWIDRQSLEGGQSFRSAIVSAIDACDAIVVALSPASNNSAMVIRELNYAEEKRKPIIPIVVRGVKLSGDMALQLSGIQRIDCETDLTAGIKSLVAALKRPFGARNRMRVVLGMPLNAADALLEARREAFTTGNVERLRELEKIHDLDHHLRLQEEKSGRNFKAQTALINALWNGLNRSRASSGLVMPSTAKIVAANPRVIEQSALAVAKLVDQSHGAVGLTDPSNSPRDWLLPCLHHILTEPLRYFPDNEWFRANPNAVKHVLNCGRSSTPEAEEEALWSHAGHFNDYELYLEFYPESERAWEAEEYIRNGGPYDIFDQSGEWIEERMRWAREAEEMKPFEEECDLWEYAEEWNEYDLYLRIYPDGTFANEAAQKISR